MSGRLAPRIVFATTTLIALAGCSGGGEESVTGSPKDASVDVAQQDGALSETGNASATDGGPTDSAWPGDATSEVAHDADGQDAPHDAGLDAEPDAAWVDPCESVNPACPPAPAGYGEGDGLKAIDRCAFPMDETSVWTSYAPLVDALAGILPHASVEDVLADTNRTTVTIASVPGGPAGMVRAFRWDDVENDKAWWIPQGITGSADADPSGLVGGHHVVVVSSYYDMAKHPGSSGEKGVRLSFVDVPASGPPRYRMALLVQPSGTASAPSFEPIVIHAGGIAWFGDTLYVADTGKGFRVFDTGRIYRVATDQDVIGCSGSTCHGGLYKYVLPQIGGYAHASSCSPRFSFVSLDRTASSPSLLSGEYCSSTACSAALSGRLFRWPLDVVTGRLRAPRSWPSQALLMGQLQVQGGAANGDMMMLSSSKPAAGGGALYRVTTSGSATSAWVDAPEDLMVDVGRAWVWSLSEALGSRVVFAAQLSSYPAP